MNEPRCIALREASAPGVGGKAEGLAWLIDAGFRVPDGFVIIGATATELPSDLDQRYEDLGGGRVAVRSSAMGEDSGAASHAGQYATILNVEGRDALRAAIVECIQSSGSGGAAAYRAHLAPGDQTSMGVVVQRMLDARVAGVVFTFDPASARRDRVIVDAVPGLGESLVGGRVTPDHWVLSKSGTVVESEIASAAPSLNPSELAGLVAEALRAERLRGEPLDIEWALDRDGELWFLQARPVARAPADPNELDSVPRDGAVHTWANIGEMMPGAVTPLTYSVTGRGIDIGMKRMYRRIGSAVPESDEPRYVAMFYGHLFLNLQTLSTLCADVAGSTKEQLCLALCGRDVEELEAPPPSPSWRRALNGARYFAILLSSRRYAAELDRLLSDFSIATHGDVRQRFEAIDEALPVLWRAYELHLLSSAAAGALSPILLGVVARGEEPTSEHHAEVARMLAGATAVESADIAVGAERILECLADHPHARDRFASTPPDQALQWVSSPASGQAGVELARYLQRHGHRAVRELELRQRGWGTDPMPVIASLQAGLRARLERPQRPARRAASRAATRRMPKPMLQLAHRAIRSREHSKSALVAITSEFKQAYRALGKRLADEGALPDEDAVFFLLHDELGLLVDGERALAETAKARRRVIAYQMPLSFPQIFLGRPEPIGKARRTTNGLELVGRPVSPGVVRGRARVVHALQEAAAVESGEVLIAPVTDVGWTPYFAVIAGIATDVGSAVSHGAVVAREYGLPAVVNLRVATTSFRTGDEVILDGDRGTLSLAGRADGTSSEGS